MKAAIFDTETTALIKNSGQNLDKQPRIVEFSGLLVEDDGTVLEEIDFLCHPGIALPEDTIRITGLTDADLKGKPSFKDMQQKVMDFFLKADACVAHNLSYDMSIVNFELERTEFREVFAWPKRKICTVEATEHILGYRLSLGVLYEYLFKETFEGAHRAKNDVKALTRIYTELLSRGVI